MKTQYIFIDTCCWIDNVLLIRSGEDKKVLEVLEDKISKKELVLILPETVEIEFIRRLHHDLDVFKTKVGELKRFFEKSPINELALYPLFKDKIKDILDKEASVVESDFKEAKETVLKIFAHPNVIKTKITPDILVNAQKRGMKGLAPYQYKNKEKKTILHSGIQSDCIIIEELKDFFSNESNYELSICTDNVTDFADKQDQSVIHPDIKSEFIACTLFTKVSTFLNKFKANIDEEKLTKPVLSDFLSGYAFNEQAYGVAYASAMAASPVSPFTNGTVAAIQTAQSAVQDSYNKMLAAQEAMGTVSRLANAIDLSKRAFDEIKTAQTLLGTLVSKNCSICGKPTNSAFWTRCSECYLKPYMGSLDSERNDSED